MSIFGEMTKQINGCWKKDDEYENTQYYQESIIDNILYEYISLVSHLLQTLIQHIHSNIFSMFNDWINTIC